MNYDNFTENDPMLKDINWEDGELITKSPFHQVGHNTRLYYKIRGENNGFTFCTVEFRQCAGWCEDVWTDPEVEVGIICSGIAFFDGIRHLWMPYWHYPDMGEASEIFRFLGELVKHTTLTRDDP